MMPTKSGAATALICESDVWLPSPASIKKGSFDDNYFKKGVNSGLLVRELKKEGWLNYFSLSYIYSILPQFGIVH